MNEFLLQLIMLFTICTAAIVLFFILKIYQIYNRPYLLSIIVSLLILPFGFAYGFINLLIDLPSIGAVVYPIMAIGMEVAIIIGQRKLISSLLFKSEESWILLKEDIMATRTYGNLANEFLGKIVPVIGTESVKNVLDKCIERHSILKGCYINENEKLNVDSIEKNLNKIDEGERLKELSKAFNDVNSHLMELRSAIVPHEEVIEDLRAAIGNAIRRCDSLYEWLLPAILFKIVLESLLVKCGPSDIGEIRVKTREIDISTNGEINIERFYSGKINVVDAFLRILHIYYPIIQRSMGSEANKLATKNFRRLSPEIKERLYGNGMVERLPIGILEEEKITLSSRKKLIRELTKKKESLEALQEVSEVLAGTMDLRETLTLILESLERKLGFFFAAITLVNREKNCLDNYMVGSSVPIEKIEKMVGLDFAKVSMPLTTKENLLVRTILSGEPQFTNKLSDYSRPVVGKRLVAPVQKMLGIKLIGTVPLATKEKVVGVLSFAKKTRGLLTDEEKKSIMTLANQAGLAIERAMIYKDLKEAYRELAEAKMDRIKSNFIDTMAHELRTPLTSIKTYIDLLRKGDLGEISDLQREKLGIATKNVSKLKKLIDNMLEIPTMNADDLELSRESLLVGELMEEVVEESLSETKLKEHKISIDFPNSLVVEGDRSMLGKAFKNLLVNAMKYTPEKGEIKIAGRKEGKNIHIKIEDNGIGIPKEDLYKIFNPFYTVEKSDGGMGLGLAITKNIIEGHGGEIWVESELGKGSIFHLLLPGGKNG